MKEKFFYWDNYLNIWFSTYELYFDSFFYAPNAWYSVLYHGFYYTCMKWWFLNTLHSFFFFILWEHWDKSSNQCRTENPFMHWEWNSFLKAHIYSIWSISLIEIIYDVKFFWWNKIRELNQNYEVDLATSFISAVLKQNWLYHCQTVAVV